MNLQLLIAKDLPFECFGFGTSLDVDVPMGLARRTSPSQVPVLTSTFLSVWLQVQVPVLTLTVLSVWLQIHVPVLTLRFLSVTRLQVQVPVLPLAFLSVWLQVPVLTLTFLSVWLQLPVLIRGATMVVGNLVNFSRIDIIWLCCHSYQYGSGLC
jgi:hypothetical protein